MFSEKNVSKTLGKDIDEKSGELLNWQTSIQTVYRTYVRKQKISATVFHQARKLTRTLPS